MINQTPNQMTPTLKFIYSASAVVCIVAMLGMPCKAQRKPKWIEGGGPLYFGYFKKSDTTNKTYYLYGKDSISFKVSVEDCNCSFYINMLNKKRTPCKNMKRHFMLTEYWNFFRTDTLIKGKQTKIGDGHWETYTGEYSMYDGTYTIGNKQVYPKCIFRKGKLEKIPQYQY